MSAQPLPLTDADKKYLESADRQLSLQLEIQILARCIGAALSLGSPLKIEVHYAPQGHR